MKHALCAFLLGVIVVAGGAPFACAALIPLPDQVKVVISDAQDAQVPDRVHLTGWVGSRMSMNESNRLAELDVNRLLEGYRHRPGRQTWDGEHIGKWLHAATLAWVNTGDPKLRKKLDYVAAELCKCQEPDGYLGTYTKDKRWTEWDVWAHKYNLIGLLTYMRYTGNTAPLECCRRMADLLCHDFGANPGQHDIIEAGFHMGMAPTSVLEPMVMLYRFTGELRYLEFCRYILRAWEQPNGAKVISTLLTAKRVDKVGNAKAYEMLSCLNGLLEYYRTVGEPQAFQACSNAWQDIVDNRLYPTGTASYREHFHEDYDFPNNNDVGETCVTVTWMQFNENLLRLTGEKKFADQLEKTTLNQLMGAQSCDGTQWGYYVQMEGHKPYTNNLDGNCCLSSGPRGVALLATFAATTDADGVVMNLYDSGTADLKLRQHGQVKLTTQTEYPVKGAIRMTVNEAPHHEFAIKVRIPAWSPDALLQVNGADLPLTPGADGYVAITRHWRKNDIIDLHLEVEPRIVVGDHKNAHKLAVFYGPLVLAADAAISGMANNEVPDFSIPDPDVKRLKVTMASHDKADLWPDAPVFNLTDNGTNLPTRLVTFADAGAGGSEYEIWMPFGPAPTGRNLLLDGVESRSRKGNEGGSIIDENFQSIAVTFNNKAAKDDWYGVTLRRPSTISRIVFTHGKTFHDGGWFDTSGGKPVVLIRTGTNDPWKPLCVIADYPAATASDAHGLRGGEKFTVKLNQPVTITAIRVIGTPASGDNPNQSFSSCAELEAFNTAE